MNKPTSGGGWPAVWYAIRTARRAGLVRFFRAMGTKNACKTCALGMGGQAGGMVDESGRFPEVCKKSMQAMAADMQGRIAPEFWSRYDFNQLRRFSPRDLEHMGRLVQPVLAGPDDDRFRPISWDEALASCAERLRSVSPRETFFYSSGRSSNEAAFLMQLFARLYGTNNVNNCSYYCHQASSAGLAGSIGSGVGTIDLEDLNLCDLFFLIGGNPASNHPRLMRQLAKIRRRGGHVVVINPLRETGLVNFSVPSDLRSLLFGSEIASLYVQPHIGGDIALLAAVAKRILDLNAHDPSFIDRSTDGWCGFREHLDALTWPDLLEQSGCDRPTLDRIAELYANSSNAVFAWTMGITHHLHGVDNVRAIANLALLRGMIGKPGAGLLPIRGHSNVQGVGSVGVTPKLRDAVFQRLQDHFGVTLPLEPGLDTLACIDAMHAGRLRVGWCLGGNLFGATPDARRAESAFARLDSLVYFSTTLNTGHVFGRARETIILPVLPRDEEPQPTTQESMFSFVRMSEGGPPRHDGLRSEVELVAALASLVLENRGPVDWNALRQHRNIRRAIGAIVPGYEAIADIDDTGREFHIADRVLHQPKFKTPTGRAKFHAVPLPSFAPPSPGRLRLMTLRSEGQFNTVVYEEEDLYRGQDRRDVILLHPSDIQRLGLHVDQPVTVRGPAGEMHNIRVRPFDIRPGNAAMYYPEANVLIPAAADPESRTPAFKHVPVELVPSRTGT